MTNAEIQALKNMGVSPQAILRLGKNNKGVGVTSIVGTVEVNVQVPGSAVVFLGFAAISSDDTDIIKMQFTVQLNNETIVDAVDLAFLTPKERSIGGMGGYNETMRRLTGKDVLKVQITSTVSHRVQLCFYYLNEFGATAQAMNNLRG